MTKTSSWYRHINYRLILTFLVFWTPVIIFMKLAGEVIEQEPLPADTAILKWLHAHESPFLDQFFYAFTSIGGIAGMVILAGVLTGLFIYRRKYKSATFLLASVGGAVVANVILKALFHRDRPSLFRTLVHETSFSFPSGHAMASSAMALSLILLFWPTKWRWPVTIVSALTALIISVSRPYFGVHYPSDIVAGWCASIAWVLLVYYIINRFGGQWSFFRPHRSEASDLPAETGVPREGR